MAIEDGIVLYHSMNQSVVDLSGNGHDGSVTGGVYDNTITKLYPYSLKLEGIDDLDEVPDHADLDPGSGAWSLGIWVYWEGQNGLFFHKGQNEGGVEQWRFGVRDDSGDVLEALWASGPGQIDQIRSTTALTKNIWNFVQFKFSGSANGYIFKINNVDAGLSFISDQPAGAIESAYSLRMGMGQTGGLPYDGYMNAATIWNREITDDEDDELWNGGDGIRLFDVSKGRTFFFFGDAN